MSDHAPLSPSARHRWGNCPGSVREGAKYPEPPPGPAAIDGTHSHKLLEHCIKANLGDPMDMVGITMKDDDGEFVVDKERAQRVKVAVDYVIQQVAAVGGAAAVHAEMRVDPAPLVGRNDMGGTVDIQIRSSAELEIIDYKDGMNPVDAEGNEQLRQYAVGVMAGLVRGPITFDRVRMTIIQPKLALKGLPAISTCVVPVSEIVHEVDVLVQQGKATDDPNAPLVPGDKQCRYCRATGCAARAGQSLQAAGVSFPAMGAAQQVANQDTGQMTDERLREILEAAPLMRQTIEAAEAEAQRRMDAGHSIPGLKLVYGRGSQVWNMDDEKVAEKLQGMGVPKAAVYVTKVVSPAQAKKITWTNRKGENKGLTERQLKTLETEYITKLAGKLTVAPESDPRPAVVRDAAPLFSAVQPPVEQPALPSWLS
ncbi:Protein of unknown function DUF2800 [uncultured Caudovirales phage]|uniref:Uncharacterized protein n=1 Tax=uncultured Caudovirales phage TaxID=2100421 RepID=A0A6J5NBM8_9CAUD|nr:Protein of unknown function DUF2800 [uncultured Caudovirales phage]CAB4156032.1 Protein of unknown function DUF2800 [uncultured Caudovirales phage]CAB4213487.1 Protein of unknown function DUF2800 [uncultured Caudovirales phage]